MKHAIWLVALAWLAACASTSENERAAKIRVTLDREDVKGCQSLGVVNATGDYEDATTALRHGAARIERADTALLKTDVVPVVKTFRDAKGNPYTVTSVRGPVGEAFRCSPSR